MPDVAKAADWARRDLVGSWEPDADPTDFTIWR
jgi:hypothetical protein